MGVADTLRICTFAIHQKKNRMRKVTSGKDVSEGCNVQGIWGSNPTILFFKNTSSRYVERPLHEM